MSCLVLVYRNLIQLYIDICLFFWGGFSPCRLSQVFSRLPVLFSRSFWLPIWYMVVCMSEKATAPHSSTLAWKIPWMEEPGGLQSMGSIRVGHDWTTSLSLFTFMHWRRKWQHSLVFLPGESQGWRSLVGCHLWGHTESDTTEAT